MSNLFKPYRAVGVYSGNAPGIVYFHGRRRYHIAEIPIDNCFHSYKGKNWSLGEVMKVMVIFDRFINEVTALK